MTSGLKNGKTAGNDGIANEVWKFGGGEVREWVCEFCNRVWVGEGWPGPSKEGIVIPLINKGEGKVVEECRGITLMPTLYEVQGVPRKRAKSKR